jgi:hypothetical protein
MLDKFSFFIRPGLPRNVIFLAKSSIPHSLGPSD